MGALDFKNCLLSDISGVFLNSLEFAERHNLNGQEMVVMIDDNELLEREKAKLMDAPLDGIYKSRRLLYVSKADFGARPAQSAILTLDGRPFRVKECAEEGGVFVMELERVRS